MLNVVDDALVDGFCWNPPPSASNENPVAGCGGVAKLGWTDTVVCAPNFKPDSPNIEFDSDKSYIHLYLERLQIRETYVAFVVAVAVVVVMLMVMVCSNLMTLLPVLEQVL